MLTLSEESQAGPTTVLTNKVKILFAASAGIFLAGIIVALSIGVAYTPTVDPALQEEFDEQAEIIKAYELRDKANRDSETRFLESLRAKYDVQVVEKPKPKTAEELAAEQADQARRQAEAQRLAEQRAAIQHKNEHPDHTLEWVIQSGTCLVTGQHVDMSALFRTVGLAGGDKSFREYVTGLPQADPSAALLAGPILLTDNANVKHLMVVEQGTTPLPVHTLQTNYPWHMAPTGSVAFKRVETFVYGDLPTVTNNLSFVATTYKLQDFDGYGKPMNATTNAADIDAIPEAERLRILREYVFAVLKLCQVKPLYVPFDRMFILYAANKPTVFLGPLNEWTTATTTEWSASIKALVEFVTKTGNFSALTSVLNNLKLMTNQPEYLLAWAADFWVDFNEQLLQAVLQGQPQPITDVAKHTIQPKTAKPALAACPAASSKFCGLDATQLTTNASAVMIEPKFAVDAFDGAVEDYQALTSPGQAVFKPLNLAVLSDVNALVRTPQNDPSSPLCQTLLMPIRYVTLRMQPYKLLPSGRSLMVVNEAHMLAAIRHRNVAYELHEMANSVDVAAAKAIVKSVLKLVHTLWVEGASTKPDGSAKSKYVPATTKLWRLFVSTQANNAADQELQWLMPVVVKGKNNSFDLWKPVVSDVIAVALKHYPTEREALLGQVDEMHNKQYDLAQLATLFP